MYKTEEFGDVKKWEKLQREIMGRGVFQEEQDIEEWVEDKPIVIEHKHPAQVQHGKKKKGKKR